MSKFYISTSSFDNLIVTVEPRPGDKEITLQRAYDLFHYGRPEFTDGAVKALHALTCKKT
jgi:hypothetical protein